MKAKIQRVNDIVTDVTFKCGATDSLTMYHLSDIHIDSPFCDRKLLEKHLKQAEEEQAPVLIAGDVFDSMQTHDDPRRRPEEMKAEYHVSHYLDAIVMDAVSLFKKYKLQYIIGMGNHECLDEQTEVLTSSGWKSIKDVALDDDVLSMQGVDMESVFAKPLRTHAYEYHGDMIRVKTTRLDMLMTPNHRVAYIPQKRNDISYMEARELGNRHTVNIPTSTIVKYDEYPIKDDEIRYAAWVLTDGYIGERGEHVIYQSKPATVEHIEHLLERLNIKFSKYERQRDRGSICGRELISEPLSSYSFGVLFESRGYTNSLVDEKRKLPAWVFKLSKRQFDIFMNELILGDGSVNHNTVTSRVLYGEREILDEVQRAATMYGYRTRLVMRHRDGKNDYLALNITEHESVRQKMKNAITTERFDGYVYCLTTVTGNFFVRRNGTVYLTGNSVILRKLNTGLIDRLVYGLNAEGGDAIGMGYHGYLRLKFNYKNGKATFRKTIYFHHGKSSNAVVTRGVIQTNRQAVYMHDADLVHNGHLHEAWVLPITRERLAENGEPYTDQQWHMMTPGYKGSGMATGETFGYGVEKHPAPKPKGCARVEYEYSKDRGVKIQPILIIE